MIMRIPSVPANAPKNGELNVPSQMKYTPLRNLFATEMNHVIKVTRFTPHEKKKRFFLLAITFNIKFTGQQKKATASREKNV